MVSRYGNTLLFPTAEPGLISGGLRSILWNLPSFWEEHAHTCQEAPRRKTRVPGFVLWMNEAQTIHSLEESPTTLYHASAFRMRQSATCIHYAVVISSCFNKQQSPTIMAPKWPWHSKLFQIQRLSGFQASGMGLCRFNASDVLFVC